MLNFGEPIFNYWFLLPIQDDNVPTNYIAVRRKPLNYEEEYILKKQLQKGKKIIGLSSFGDFPKNEKIFLDQYGKHIILWCHCFKNPEIFIPPSIPTLLLSETDLYPFIPFLLSIPESSPKQYDFLCYLPFHSTFKNAEKAVGYLNQLANKYKIIAFTNDDYFPNLIVAQKLYIPWEEFITYLSSSRFLINFAEEDASPRTIIEAIYLNVPVLVNKDIYGGWKYIIPGITGNFIHLDQDFETQIDKFYNDKHYNPRRYALDHFLTMKDNSQILKETITNLENLNMTQFADYFIYINLKNRKDRRLSIEFEMNRLQIPKDKIIRIDAIENKKNGHLGCCESHIFALESCLKMEGKRFMIFEDDFEFSLSKERICYMLQKFIQEFPDFDIFLLYCFQEFEIITKNRFIYRIINASSTIGYWMNKEKIPIFLQCFNNARNKLIQETQECPHNKKISYTKYAIDQMWKNLQKDYFFYTTIPMIGNPKSRLYSSII